MSAFEVLGVVMSAVWTVSVLGVVALLAASVRADRRARRAPARPSLHVVDGRGPYTHHDDGWAA